MATILVVDDDEAISIALKTALEIKGYSVVGASDANEALIVAKQFPPDLILLDYLLSGSNGLEVIKKIRANPLLQKVPVIMLSAHPHAQAKAREAGMTAFLQKPFDLQVLYKMVGKFLIISARS